MQVIRDQIERQLALQMAPPSPAKRREASHEVDNAMATNLQSSEIDSLHKVKSWGDGYMGGLVNSMRGAELCCRSLRRWHVSTLPLE